MPTFRAILTAALFLVASVAVAAPTPAADDMSLGSPKAKIQVIEYASLSCPHCARFNAETFPAFKAKYVDTGKVRYTLKEFLTPPENVAAAGFLMARCAGPAKYFKVVDEVFRSQPRWQSGSIKPILMEIGAANGLNEAQFNACLSDPKAQEALNARMKRAVEQDKVTGTPTIFVNGKEVGAGEISLQQLDAAIAAASK
jgi:protein-disulfide isomerase